MKVIKCNLCGKKHINKGMHCEDSIFVSERNSVVSVAVADGAGSSKYPCAKQGADTVTKAICEFLCDRFDEFFDAANELEVRKVVAAVCQKALKTEAEIIHSDTTETMASTLLCVSIKGNKMIACHIGDGIIGRISNGVAEAVTRPQNGEFASSTYFINSPDAYQMLQIRRTFLYSTSHLFLMTDGVSESVFNDYNGEFDPVMAELAELSEKEDGSFLLEESIQKYVIDSNEYSDDSTIAVIKTDFQRDGCADVTVNDNEEEKNNSISEKTDSHSPRKIQINAIVALSTALIVVLSILFAVLLTKQNPTNISEKSETTISSKLTEATENRITAEITDTEINNESIEKVISSTADSSAVEKIKSTSDNQSVTENPVADNENTEKEQW